MLGTWRRLSPQAQDVIAAAAIVVTWMLATSALRTNRLMLPSEPDSWVFAAWASALAMAFRRSAPLIALAVFGVGYAVLYPWDL